MVAKRRTWALWLTTLVLLVAFAWSANLTMFNWRASGGPPVEHPEIYKTRGNIFFAVSCVLLLAFLFAVWSLIGRYRVRS